jgi:thiamine biosynthesis lipoprotein
MRALITLLLFAALCGCSGEKHIYKTQGHVFGTVVEVSIYGETQQHADALSAQVLKEFDRLHHKLHAWQPSILTALNDAIARGQPFQADAELVQLLQGAAAL